MSSSPLQVGRPPSRRTLLVGAAALVAVAVVLGGSFTGKHHGGVVGGSGGGTAQLVGQRQQIAADPSAAAAVARTEQAFSLDLLRHVRNGDGNVSVSPLSLALALSMLENGAAARTRSEIAATLGAGDLSLAQQNAGWHALNADLAEAAKTGSIQLSTANSAWLQKGSSIRQPFLNALKTYYDTGVWTTDFAHNMPAALAAINAWTSQNTRGKITKLFDKLDPSTLLVLANAVYFKAAWATPFEASDTHDARFITSNRSTITTKFLNGVLDAPTAATPEYQAVQLPYAGGRFAALAVMPTAASLTDFTASLTAGGLSTIVDSLASGPVHLSLPKFSTRTTSQLNAPLAAMGMPTAFTDAADFSTMTPTKVSVSQVVQRVYLKVAEKGTEAAAATGIAVGMSAVAEPPRTLTFDHPFLFLIRDTTTGAILFASQITDPSAG